jgi:hypothetical protein
MRVHPLDANRAGRVHATTLISPICAVFASLGFLAADATPPADQMDMMGGMGTPATSGDMHHTTDQMMDQCVAMMKMMGGMSDIKSGHRGQTMPDVGSEITRYASGHDSHGGNGNP